MNRLLPVLLVLATLTGCVASNVRELTEQGVVTPLTSPRNWEEVYRSLTLKMQQCIAMQSPLAASFSVDGQIYSETRLGEITVTFPKGPFNGQMGPVAQVQVRPEGVGSAIVVTAIDNALGRNTLKRISLWLGGSEKCG